MVDINLTNIFDDFYHTRFFVLLNLSIFSFLFALRLDETIKWSYWLVFMPLWIWKAACLVGMLMGTISWCRLSRRRFEGDTFLQYKAMLISFSTNLIIFLFEIIVCDKLDTRNSIPWTICFVPLFILSLVSIGTCIWSIRHDRSYEIELFCSLNLLQFVFISLRLDETISWSWILVLIPLWILMCIAFIILLYFVIITIVIVSRSHPNNLQHHHSQYKPTQRWLNVIYYTLFAFSVLVFEVMLTHKLDHEMASQAVYHNLQYNPHAIYLSSSNHHQPQQQQLSSSLELSATDHHLQKSPFDHVVGLSTFMLSYFITNLPLQIAYLCLMLLSFNSHSGNLWWFGMRRDFCELFLVICPLCKIYGNIQLKFSCYSPSTSNSSTTNRQTNNRNRNNNNNQIRTSTIIPNNEVNFLQPLQQQNQLLLDTNSNELSLTTLNMNMLRNHRTTINTNNNTNNPTIHTLSQQNQFIGSDCDELSSMEDCLEVANISTSSSAGVVVIASNAATTSSVNNNNNNPSSVILIGSVGSGGVGPPSMLSSSSSNTNAAAATSGSNNKNRRLKFLNNRFHFYKRNNSRTSQRGQQRRRPSSTTTLPTTLAITQITSLNGAERTSLTNNNNNDNDDDDDHNTTSCLPFATLLTGTTTNSPSTTSKAVATSKIHQEKSSTTIGTIIQLDLPD